MAIREWKLREKLRAVDRAERERQAFDADREACKLCGGTGWIEVEPDKGAKVPARLGRCPAEGGRQWLTAAS
jgi:hypothetical protein